MSGDAPVRGRVIDATTEHTIKNHLAVIVGFSELLLTEIAPDDARRNDLQEILHAAKELMVIFRRDVR